MGIFNSLVAGMSDFINMLYKLTDSIGIPNYGLAIILLTVIIKMLLYPLTKKQMLSMRSMQQLQPKIKELQNKYKGKDQQQIMQQKTMELYKEHNINPMAGCLPLLIQMPILIALYRALYNFKYLNTAHANFLWVPNLSNVDPWVILPILAGASTYLQSKLTTTTSDPTQQIMLYTMPLFIGYISYKMPAGLALYWVVFNLVGAIQQYYINKHDVGLEGGVVGK
ncbi:60 kDa inner membrane insertion protein [Desulfofarcimen acetoxidans DSM 771]|jgi:YidC/Oxa1 family membrane protein insertase|uniref:60 kDa inner membrane insertion protein n=1 Tax=Desulfofarcimen acetoxidans (strain ATCC 49208 / DSM 771 / KCTC 5769 / VKM B-1644 / 5575) TaxID=485916 RepID=C8W062_DESAS|nr:YidC/Oxa1 family membrane protein insertase [Desulfofarcimen acetoxidans]ACV65030.1 60 kDa inner membrane insertion protein [Desulfofarcimen acetoxidans DSM 771]